jgi:hypothetical protein
LSVRLALIFQLVSAGYGSRFVETLYSLF